tara:strand:+ start:73 stop:387 length:315 start_codon:yes stop_codon:yes gene_type:complete
MKKKNNGYTKQFRSDSPDTYLTDVNQQRALLLDTLDMELEKNKKEMSQVQKRINTYIEPKMNDLDHIAESRLRYESRKTKTKPPEFFEKNFGLAGILQVSKRKK